MDFFNPALAPFTIALLVMIAFALIEIFGLVLGLGVSELIDNVLPDFDVEIDAVEAPDFDGIGVVGQVFAWLSIGKVPILILLAIFLTAFGLSGYMVQSIVMKVWGGFLPVPISVSGALFAALPITRHAGLLFARLMPKEQTDAVSSDTFIGRTAVILRGTASIDNPAEAKLTDALGATHYILVEPDREATRFEQGQEVLLVEKEVAIFKAIKKSV